MIKGVYIKNLPSFDGISDPEILEEFDVMNEDDSKFTSFVGTTYEMEQHSYSGKNYNFLAISVDDNGLKAMWNIYNTIQKAIPDLIKVIKYSDNVILVVKHNLKTTKEQDRYERLIDEIVRLCAWLIRDFDDYIIEPRDLLKSFFDMCVNIGNKNKD